MSQVTKRMMAGLAAVCLILGAAIPVSRAATVYIYPQDDGAAGTYNWSATAGLWSSARDSYTQTAVPAADDAMYMSFNAVSQVTINIDVDPPSLGTLRHYATSDNTPGETVLFQPSGADRDVDIWRIGSRLTSLGGGDWKYQGTADYDLSLTADYLIQFGAPLYLGGTTDDTALKSVQITDGATASTVAAPIYLNAETVQIDSPLMMGRSGNTGIGLLYLYNNAEASADKTIKIGALSNVGTLPGDAAVYASKAYEGATARQATMELTGTNDTYTTLAQLKDNPGGDSTMTLRVTKTGGSTQIFESGSSDYSGGTDISAGSLLVNNTSGNALGTGEVKVHTAGLIGGSGSFTASLVVDDGGTVSPGESIESLATGSNTWKSGGAFTLEMSTDGSSGSAGAEWDQLVITGDLDLTGTTSADPFTINVVSMSDASTEGLLASFDKNAGATWAGFVTTTEGITGFSADKFAFNTNDFQNALLGRFSVSVNGNNLDLVYIPMPSSLGLIGLGVIALLARRRALRP
jgi:autotransporter-associated beta strand protein